MEGNVGNDIWNILDTNYKLPNIKTKMIEIEKYLRDNRVLEEDDLHRPTTIHD